MDIRKTATEAFKRFDSLISQCGKLWEVEIVAGEEVLYRGSFTSREQAERFGRERMEAVVRWRVQTKAGAR